MTDLRESLDTRPCPGFFEKVFTGEDGRPMQFYSSAHRIGVFMTRDQVVPGHTLIVPEQCVPRIDQLSPNMSDRVNYVSAHVGARMLVSGVSSKPTQELVFGDDVAHAHKHRVPSHERGDVIAGFANKTFVDLSTGQLEELHGLLRFPDELVELIESQLDLSPKQRVHPLDVAGDFVTRPS